MATVGAKVKTLKEKFGFIEMDAAIGEETDAFFLPTVMERGGPRFEDLRVGQRVEADVEEGERGLRASAVRVRG